MMDEPKEFDDARIQALEEVVYHTSSAFEALMNLLVDKGFVTERELLEKMDGVADQDDDIEEVGFDANAPREPDDDDELLG